MADPAHDEWHPRTPDFNAASPWGVVECTAPRLCITPHATRGGEDVFGVCASYAIPLIWVHIYTYVGTHV